MTQTASSSPRKSTVPPYPFSRLSILLPFGFCWNSTRILCFQIGSNWSSVRAITWFPSSRTFCKTSKKCSAEFVSKTQQSILLIIGLESNLQATCPFWWEWTIGWKELLSFCYQISCGKSKSCDFPRAFLPQVSRIFYSHSLQGLAY